MPIGDTHGMETGGPGQAMAGTGQAATNRSQSSRPSWAARTPAANLLCTPNSVNIRATMRRRVRSEQPRVLAIVLSVAPEASIRSTR